MNIDSGFRFSQAVWRRQGEIDPGSFPEKQPAGVAVESFLRSTKCDSIGALAPYVKEGEFALDVHRQVLTIARAGLESYQAIGSSSPLTLAGLSQALRNQADLLRSQAVGQATKAAALADTSLVQKAHQGLRLGARTGLSWGIQTAGAVTLGGAALMVALGWAGMSITPEMLAASGGSASVLGALSLAGGALKGLVAGTGAAQLQSEFLSESSSTLKKRANAQDWAAGHLEQWNLRLSGSSPS
jgi:hypothetical protein